MTNKNVILILIAVMIVAATLADAGCIGAIRNIVVPETPTLTPTPIPATPTPMPNVTATPTPTPMPTAPGHVDLIYTLPPEAGVKQNSSIHNIYGNITYNGNPAIGYEVLVDTINGSEYGNKTDANGLYSVTFRDDWSPTYVLKIIDNLNVLIYTDKLPRFVNQTGLISVQISSPSTNVITVSITP
jgi:hypothetical protein